jgi:hypothetical protein
MDAGKRQRVPAVVGPTETQDNKENSAIEIDTTDLDFEYILDQLGWDISKEVVVKMCGSKHIRVNIEMDLNQVGIVDVNAVLDTGSEVSFLHREILTKNAPELLEQLQTCPLRFSGIGGNALPVDGLLPVTFKVEGKIIHHHFVIADISEEALLGLDFYNKYKVNWDWLRRRITFDQRINFSKTIEGRCQVLEDIEIDPETVKRIQVQLIGTINPEHPVFIQDRPGSIENIK